VMIEILEKARLSNTEMFHDMRTLLEVTRYSKMIMQQVVRTKVITVCLSRLSTSTALF
jgi:hypothetical protein